MFGAKKTNSTGDDLSAAQVTAEVAKFRDAEVLKAIRIPVRQSSLNTIYQSLMGSDPELGCAYLKNLKETQQIVLPESEQEYYQEDFDNTSMEKFCNAGPYSIHINPLVAVAVLTKTKNLAKFEDHVVDLTVLNEYAPGLVNALMAQNIEHIAQYENEARTQGLTALSDTLFAIRNRIQNHNAFVMNPEKLWVAYNQEQMNVELEIDAKLVKRAALKAEVDALLHGKDRQQYFEGALETSLAEYTGLSRDIIKSLPEKSPEELSQISSFIHKLHQSGDLMIATDAVGTDLRLSPLHNRLLEIAVEQAEHVRGFPNIGNSKRFPLLDKYFELPEASGLVELKGLVSPEVGSELELLFDKAIEKAKALEAVPPAEDLPFSETEEQPTFFQKVGDFFKDMWTEFKNWKRTVPRVVLAALSVPLPVPFFFAWLGLEIYYLIKDSRKNRG